ncbi:MAG: hypothetical protein CH6_0417 [Candidatus Kapaibacterium sp.]|nr:MAG: hypothetical protein CH6_0417 [Candidatus Kapabacteria bacterium]
MTKKPEIYIKNSELSELKKTNPIYKGENLLVKFKKILIIL